MRDLARTEPDPEIHALIHDSAGLNLALDLSARRRSPTTRSCTRLDADLASRIVWFDAYVTNVDRTARNTNMLMWHRRPWLIDHGATLYFHHAPGWEQEAARAARSVPADRKPRPPGRGRARSRPSTRRSPMALADGVLESILDWVPDAWLTSDVPGRSPDDTRAAYVRYLRDRLMAPRPFLAEAPRAV